MLGRAESELMPTTSGTLEVLHELPAHPARGLVVIAHPLPTMGGTMDNKVVASVARAYLSEGWVAVRFNFRGVGRSEGQWDEGRGEVQDMLAVVANACARHEGLSHNLALAGFSFGAAVAAVACTRLPPALSARTLSLVAPAVSRFEVPKLPPGSLVVHGEADDVVPLSAILQWARTSQQAVTVVPEAGHFFHGQLGPLRELIQAHIRGLAPRSSA